MELLNTFLSEHMIQRIGWVLVHFLWQGITVAVLMWCVLKALGRVSSGIRYITACAGLMLMVAGPVATFVITAPEVPVVVSQIPVAKPVDISSSPATGPANTIVIAPAEPAALPAPSLWERSMVQLETALPYCVVGWVIGVAVLSVWYLGGWCQLQKLRRIGTKRVSDYIEANASLLSQRLGIRRAVRIVESALVQVPTVVGWLKPMILLPASALTGLDELQLAAMIAHELAHVKRCDYLVNIAQTVVEILGFYHPAVWWMSRRIRIERENCCDDIAVALMQNRKEYAGALFTMEAIRSKQLNLAVAANGGHLTSRISRLTGKPANHQKTGWIPSVITILLLAALLFATSMAMSDEKNVQEQNSIAETSSILEFRLIADIPLQQVEDIDGVDHNLIRYEWMPLKNPSGNEWYKNVPHRQANGKVDLLVSNQANETMPADGSWGLEKTEPGNDRLHRPAVNVVFDETGKEKFYKLTKNHIGRKLAICVDGQINSAPTIMTAIRSQAIITGSFTQEQAQHLADALQKGMPPVFSNQTADSSSAENIKTEPLIDKITLPFEVQSIHEILERFVDSGLKEDYGQYEQCVTQRMQNGRDGTFGDLVKLMRLNPDWKLSLLSVCWDTNTAMAVTDDKVKIDNSPVDGPGVIVFNLEKEDGYWLVADLDLEGLDGLQVENARFLKNHPGADTWYIEPGPENISLQSTAQYDARMESMNYLRQLAVAYYTFKDENGGDVPDNLEDLKPRLDNETYRWLVENAVLLNIWSNDFDPTKTPVAYDKTFLEKHGRRIIAFADGHGEIDNNDGLKDLLDKAIRMSNRIERMRQLMSFGVELWMWTDKHDDVLPDSIEQVEFEDELLKEWALDNVEYLAAGKVLAEIEDTIKEVIAYDKNLSKTDDGTNLLFADGHVEFCEKENLKDFIDIADDTDQSQILTTGYLVRVPKDMRELKAIVPEKGTNNSKMISPEELNTFLDTIWNNPKAKILEQPSILLNDGQTGAIKIVEAIEIPGENTSKEIGLNLSVMPHISPDGHLRIEVIMNHSRLVEEGISMTETATTVTLRSGYAIAMGGYEVGDNIEFLLIQPVIQESLSSVSSPQFSGKRSEVGSQETVEKAVREQPWEETFYNVYRLDEDQILNRISPPFIPERKDYYVTKESSQAENIPEPPDYFTFHWDGELKSWGYGFVGGNNTLDGVLRHSLSIPADQFEGLSELLEMKVPGDWIVRKGASDSKKLAALENILRDELGHRVSFEKRSVNRFVIVAKGKYKFTPPQGTYNDRHVHFYSDKLDANEGAGGGTADTVHELISVLGQRTGLQVIDETKNSKERINQPYGHHRSSKLRGIKGQGHQTDRLNQMLRNLEQQTNLKFTVEERMVSKWFVTETNTSPVMGGGMAGGSGDMMGGNMGGDFGGSGMMGGTAPVMPGGMDGAAPGMSGGMMGAMPGSVSLPVQQIKRDRQVLETEIDFSSLTADATIEEAIDLMRSSSEPPLPIVVLWADLSENAYIEKDTPIGVDGLGVMKLETGLRAIMRSLSASDVSTVDFIVEDGVITIGTSKSLPSKMQTEIYDVTDIPHLPFNFEGNTYKYIKDEIETLKKMIVHSIEPESWSENGGQGRIDIYGETKLVIYQTPQVHQKIKEYLSKKREELSVQIAIETRFLLVDENFLEDSGLNVSLPADDETSGGVGDLVVGPVNSNEILAALQIKPLAERELPPLETPKLKLRTLDDMQTEFILRAAETQRNVKMLTAPKAMVLNGEAATIQVMTEVAYIDIDDEPKYVHNGITLDVLPTIQNNGKEVLLEGHIQMTDILENQSVEHNSKTYEIPYLQVANIPIHAIVENTGTILIDGPEMAVPKRQEGDKQRLLVLIKPTVIKYEEAEPESAIGALAPEPRGMGGGMMGGSYGGGMGGGMMGMGGVGTQSEETD